MRTRIMAVLAVLALVGCNPTEKDWTDAQIDHLRNEAYQFALKYDEKNVKCEVAHVVRLEDEYQVALYAGMNVPADGYAILGSRTIVMNKNTLDPLFVFFHEGYHIVFQRGRAYQDEADRFATYCAIKHKWPKTDD